jgi:L-ascorbate metabolism protein UlaG (beta-lactamase superfamily)
MGSRGRNMFLMLLLIIVSLALAACAFLNGTKFGKSPENDRLQRILASAHYADGAFQNLTPTPTLVKGQSSLKIIVAGLFSHKERLRPSEPLPTQRIELTDPNALDRTKDVVIWLGHSSYFIRLGGKTILVDPVLSDHGSPFSFFNKTFPGTDLYAPSDMPEIDYLLITHDHWDHLDYPTVTALREKVKTVICPLGVGEDFEYWGYPKEKIQEAGWDTALRFEHGLSIHVVPARHYSGRGFARNKTLWAGFVLETQQHRLFLSGDTGYGPHFADIGRAFGSFDLVALDGGQYDPRWPLIHMTPEEAVQAAQDLGAASMMLGHVGRFCIAAHPWDEPFLRTVAASRDKSFRLLTPKIGEPVWLDDRQQRFARWWEGVL